MNKSLKIFQSIQSSVESLINNENESVEIQASAIKLKDSVGICFQEMQKSAEKLQPLIINCYEDLKQAEDLWNSKAKVLAIPQSQIWEQITQLTAIDVQIRQLQEQCKIEVVEGAMNSWEEAYNILKSKWFIDSTGYLKANIGLLDKDGLIKDLIWYFNIQNKTVTEGINSYTKKNDQELEINFDVILSYINCLHEKTKTKFLHEFFVLSYYKRNKLKESLNSGYSPFDSVVYKFINSPNFVITWQNFNYFSKSIKAHIQESVQATSVSNFKLSLEIIEEAIKFYTNFLELQNRYQQETPEQREAEKNWIEEQRQKLDKVQNEINAVLNYG